jgi:SNF2 family DNA or RNA helicase
MNHQATALRRAARQDRRGIYHDTGTGKTITAFEIFRHHGVKTLVVCPLSLIDGAWMEEVRSRYHDIDVSNLWAAKKRSPMAFNRALEKKLCLINYESFRTINKKLAKAGFEMCILDESARIRTFKRGPIVNKIKKESTVEKIIDFCDNMRYVYELSGVPAPNSVLEYWTQIRILDPLLWGKSFYKFRTKYFNPSGYGGYTWVVKAEYEAKLIADIRTVAEYVDKEDVLDLPGLVESKRIFQLSKKEMEHYKNIKNDLVTILDSGERITSPSAVTAIMKLRQISSGFLLNTITEEINGKIKKRKEVFRLGTSKLNELLALLEDIGKKQVLIWTEFQEEAVIITEALNRKGCGTGILNGTVPEKQKQEILKAFKRGDLQYAICHPKSVGFGHTLVNCTESVYYSNSYSYDNAKQSKDRMYRKGQDKKCSYYYLLAKGTLDSVILNAVSRKEDTSMAILKYLKSEK